MFQPSIAVMLAKRDINVFLNAHLDSKPVCFACTFTQCETVHNCAYHPCTIKKLQHANRNLCVPQQCIDRLGHGIKPHRSTTHLGTCLLQIPR